MADNGWTMRLLGELTENLDSSRVPVRESDRKRGKFPYYGASGIVDYVDGYLFDGEYLLIAEDGENLRTRQTPVAFLAKGKFWVNNHAHIVRGNGKATTRFLMYALANTDISGYLSGSTMPKLTQGNLNRIPILTPPVCDQRAIADFLGTLDDKIALNRRMNETLEGMARAIFNSWFVDFDPVRAKAAGRHPAGMDAATAALFPSDYEDSSLGPIPAGWSTAPLYETAKYINGAAFKSQDFCATGIGLPVVKIAELKDGVGSQTKWSQRAASNEQLIDSGDLLYSWSGSPDTSLDAFLWSNGRGLLNQHIFKVVTPTNARKRYVYYLLKYLRPTLIEIARNKQTTGLGHVTVADMKRLLVCEPPPALQRAFDNTIAPIFDRGVANSLEIKTLTSIRDTLLPKLLSGQLRIPDAEALLETA